MMLKQRLTLNGNVSSVNGSTNFVDGKYYHFYDRMLTSNTPGLYQELLASAENSIVIWDPHYRECRCDVFSAIHKDGIYIEVLTSAMMKSLRMIWKYLGIKSLMLLMIQMCQIVRLG